MAITIEQRTKLIELYVAILDRAPAAPGLAFWANALETNGGDLVYVANEMWNSEGAQADYPAFLTTGEIVERVFENVFGRAPQPEGLAFWTAEWNAFGPAQTMLTMIENMNTNPSTDPQFLLDKALFENKVAFGEWYAVTMGFTDPVLAKTASEMITSDPDSVAAAQAFVQADPAETVVLTNGTDVETTGSGNDTFLATEQTLDTSDELDGGLGDDRLEVSVEDENYFFTAPELNNIETISVTGGGSAFTGGTIDLSDANGYSLLELEENEALDFEWADIQDIINVDLRIEDTSFGWVEYDYDTNAYLSLGGGDDDIVDLELAEVDCLDIDFGNETPNGASSHVDQINLTSTNVSGINNPSTFNYVWDLNVGDYFNTLIVDGNTYLTIEEWLDPYVTLVDASALQSGIDIDLFGQGAVTGVIDTLGAALATAVTINGGTGDDVIGVASSWWSPGSYPGVTIHGANTVITTGEGDDLVQVGVLNDNSVYKGSFDDFFEGEDHCVTESTQMEDCNGTAGNQDINTGTGNDTVDVRTRGEHLIVTAAGADWIYVGGDADNLLTSLSADGETTIDSGDGNDVVETAGDGDWSIDLGAGNDELYMAGCGEDECGLGDVNVAAGTGDDYMDIDMIGFLTVDAGEGADTLRAGCDCDEDLGELNITMGAGNDYLIIFGESYDTNSDGVIDVDISLGDGDDILIWEGESGSLSLANAVSIDTGAGNDSATFYGDHRLDIDFGTGNDTLTLNADHLESQDSIDMGDGIDTIVLHNGLNADNCDFGDHCGTKSNGTVLTSETSHTSSVEVFDLRNGNIQLHLTTGLFQTAQDSHITVTTELSEAVSLPPLTLANAEQVFVFSEGMRREDWDQIVEDWEDGVYNEADVYGFTEADLLEFLFDNGIEAVDFHDVNDDGDHDLYEPVDLFDAVINGDDDDQVFFRVATCEQTVDVTAVDFSLVPDWEFTLLGGNVRDIIIANDDFLSGDYTLRFDSAGGDAESVTDTLVIEGDVDLTDMDQEQITGLECIILRAEDVNATVWEIDLTEAFVDQTTGSASLEIFVDTNVAAGSELRLYTDNFGNPANNVIIHANSNVTVYIDDAPVPPGSYEGGKLVIQNQLLFTLNADTLLGSTGNDIFYADSVAKISDADSVDGGEGTDELRLAFGVYNQNQDLEDQLDDNLSHWENVEIIRFVLPGSDSKTVGDVKTHFNIGMEGIGFLVGEGLEELHTGTGDDWLGEMEGGIEYHTYEGDDYVEIDGAFEDYGATVYAGDGDDTVYGGSGDDYIEGGNGNDDLYGGEGEDTIYGGSGNDYISGGEDDDDLYGGNGADTIYGGEGDDYISAGNDNDTVYGGEGDDTVYGGSGNDYIDGGEGNDDLYGGNGVDTIYGGSGNDYIEGNDDNDYIEGNSGSDTIHGGNGNDTIYGGTGSAVITGGVGDDFIDTNEADGDLLNIDGGDGNDTIDIEYLASNDTIIGGAGTDSLLIDTEDTLVDADFTNVSTMEILNMQNGNNVVTGNVQFEEAGFTHVYTGTGNDSLNFTGVSNASPLYISTSSGNDSVLGGLGDDTILAGTGADTVQGNAGADDIDLGVDGSGDVVVFTRGDDGALTGAETGFDFIRNFDVDDDSVLIDGLLETAVVDGGGFVPDTDNFSLDITSSAVELAAYTNTGLTDADLTDLDTMMSYLNNFLATADAGDDMLYLVQGTTDSAMYYYVENTGDNIIDASEIRILAVFDNALLEAGNIGV